MHIVDWRKPDKVSVIDLEDIRRLHTFLNDLALKPPIPLFAEPLPPFDSRLPNRLESTLATPFQVVGGEVLYPNILERATILFYLMIMNHPFQNGNKRMALLTLQVYLFTNDLWVDSSSQLLYDLAINIARRSDQKKSVKIIKSFLKDYTINLQDYK